MMNFDAVIRLVGTIEATELERWIAERWVRPDRSGGGYVFREVDVARIRLIAELKGELEVTEGDLPLVLNLLDQVYALRRHLRLLSDALEAQPPEWREAIHTHLRAALISGEEP